MADLSAASPVAAPQIEGVSLEQYAGVSAAMIEGFALPAVLASEGLDAGAWHCATRCALCAAASSASGPAPRSFVAGPRRSRAATPDTRSSSGASSSPHSR